MAIVSSVGCLLRSVAFLTLFGVLTILLIVPALVLVAGASALMLAVLAVVLPFVLIALLLWLPYLALSRDRPAARARLRARARGFGRWLAAGPLTACVRMGAWGIGVGRALAPKALPVVRRARPAPDVAAAAALAQAAKPAPTRPQLTGGVALEMIAGAALGTILVCLIDPSAPGLMLGLHILGGAVVGAILGLFVARGIRASGVA